MRYKLSLAALALSAVLSGPAVAADYEWTFQTSAAAGDNFFPIIQDWAADIEKDSGGRIHIEVIPAGAAVAHNETLNAVGAGILTGHVTDPSYFSGRDPAFGMLGNLVGAWSSPEQLFGYIREGGGHELFNELVNPYGLQFLGASTTGVESFLSTKPLRGVADLEGLKMRAPEGMVQEIFAAAGAAPVNLPGSEVYTALQKGVIDAADYTVFSTNHAQGMHEFAQYPLYPGFHSMPVMEVSMNKEIYDDLDADLQELLVASVVELGDTMTATLREADLEAVKQADADPNIEVINWSDDERAKFREIARSQWEGWAERSDMSAKVYESITSYMRETGLLAN